jgi:cytochrome b subunit of formate dehydrogenase
MARAKKPAEPSSLLQSAPDSTSVARLLVVVFLLTGLQLPFGSPASAQQAAAAPNNAMCLGCHGNPGFAMPAPNGELRQLHVPAEAFGQSVHGKQSCANCHKDVIQVPHRKGIDRKVSCVKCHQDLWAAAKQLGTAEENARLGVVVQQIENYMGSVHARPSIEDQSRTNATCYDCHNAHAVYPIDNHVGAKSRLKIPDICGKCHADIRDTYFTSVHGNEIKAGNAYAAVCTDCHTLHNIESPHARTSRLTITESCGNCHQENLETYVGTYHGKITKLGYGRTAKCFDCHGSHEVRRVDDEASNMHVNNRLQTCRNCHADATKGYISFQPHGNAHDLEKYPEMWIASKFMIGLVLVVFAFFWTHSALWYYRELKDRQQGKSRLHIRTDDLQQGHKTHFLRFRVWWRLAHFVMLFSVMLLVLTGIAVHYSASAWASVLMNILGGPGVASALHRVAAIGFIIVFCGHLLYVAFRIGQTWDTFKWFGTNSLIPNWQDFKDAAAMFRWFFGRGPRPVFERWTYWEKFDYWAVFWGMLIIGVSGLLMWFQEATASVFPGWIFNVTTIVHGEEAFLAAVFLFTVHFFNNHFRPEKFPQDITMFTGAVPLDVYKHEHGREYQRLVDSGELDKYLVDTPSRPATRASKILGGTLITFGLGLLILVLLGFLGI